MMALNEDMIKAFEFHAKKDWPREACGLVAVIKGKQHYYPCKNVAESDVDFILSPQDYIVIEDHVEWLAGDIVAVIHSHPGTSSKPTQADLVGCEQSGLTWHIYACGSNTWHAFDPSGYKAPLIGRTFKHGVFDCYSALRDWYSEKLSIAIPDFAREELWWEKGQDLFIDNFDSAGFYRVLDGSLEVGDVLLINVASSTVNHCAVYIGNDQVFHQTMNRLSSREIYGGQLKKNTRMTLRFKR